MKKSIIFACLVFLVQAVFAQGEISVVDRSINPGMVLEEFNFKESVTEEKKEYFYHDMWLPGAIYMNNGTTLSGYNMKLDLLNQQVELKVNDGIKICPVRYIDYLQLLKPGFRDSTEFINSNKLKFNNNIAVDGFLEVVQEGDYSLLAYQNIEILDPTYVPALDMGTKSKKITAEKTYFIVMGNKILCELGSNSKKLDCGKVNGLLPEGFKMKTKSEEQKIEFVQYLNNM